MLHFSTHFLDFALQVHLFFIEQLVQFGHFLLHFEVAALFILRFVIYEFSFKLRIVLNDFHLFVEQDFLVPFNFAFAFFGYGVDLLLGLLFELANLTIELLNQLVVGVGGDAEFLLDLIIEEASFEVLIKGIPDFIRPLFDYM